MGGRHKKIRCFLAEIEAKQNHARDVFAVSPFTIQFVGFELFIPSTGTSKFCNIQPPPTVSSWETPPRKGFTQTQCMTNQSCVEVIAPQAQGLHVRDLVRLCQLDPCET